MRQITGLLTTTLLIVTLGGCMPDFGPRSRTVILDGSSAEAAIPVPGIDAEYQWLAANRPGWRPVSQALLAGARGKHYDIITISRDGQSQDIFFDISGFFGKPL